MKIIHVAESFGGGVLDFLVALTHGLSEFSHVIIHGKRMDTPSAFEERFPQGTRFSHWRDAQREINPVHDVKALFQIIALLKATKDADVIHLHSSKAGFLGRLACRMLGMQERVLYSPQGVSFLRKDVSSGKARLFTYLEKTAARFGGQVVGSCASEAAAFEAVGIRATHINNGVSCEKHSSFPPSRGSLVVGTAARITNQKNPGLFNEIAQAFVADSSVEFLWIGDGELRHQLSSPNIQITGWLPKEVLTEQVRKLGIYLSTSLWEGMPLSVLLAMCEAKPLLLFDCVGNKDLVIQKQNGFLFTEKETAVLRIEELRANSLLIEGMGRQSYDLVRSQFSLANMLYQYRRLYAELGEKRKGEHRDI